MSLRLHPRIWLHDQMALVFNPRKNKSKRPFFFVHIPKTAGTAFRFVLYNQFMQSEIFPNLEFMANYYNRYPRMNEVSSFVYEWRQAKLVMGHYAVPLRKYFTSNPRIFTFLRSPVERTISNLFHIQYHQHTDGMSLEEIYEGSLLSMQNLQTRFLMSNYHTEDITAEDLESAKFELNKMSCFGITEHFSRSIELIETRFNWKLGEIQKLNVGPTENEDIPAALMQRIIDDNFYDLQLYDYALTTFEELCDNFI